MSTTLRGSFPSFFEPTQRMYTKCGLVQFVALPQQLNMHYSSFITIFGFMHTLCTNARIHVRTCTHAPMHVLTPIIVRVV